MLSVLAIGTPPSSHFIYIPVIFVLGIVLGFIFVVMGRSEMGALHRRALTLAPNGNSVLLCEP